MISSPYFPVIIGHAVLVLLITIIGCFTGYRNADPRIFHKATKLILKITVVAFVVEAVVFIREMTSHSN